MKQYPSITKQTQNIYVYAFDKLDGSNIRAEWDRKKGFCKFGSRHQLIDNTHLFLGKAPEMIRAKYEKELTDVFKKERFEKVVCFFEFFGPSSFAGVHVDEEPHDVVLFDVDVFKKGLIAPREFIKTVGHLDIPKVVYQGNLNSEFVEDVRQGKLNNVTFEGVVCKSNETDKYGHPIMFKVKSEAWLTKLRNFCKDDEKLFEQLA